MITLKNISFKVGKSNILAGIHMELKKGKVYGLLGPNGAGKTTLFKVLLNTIEYKGEVSKEDNHVPIGKLIEYPASYPNLTCAENLKLHASYADIAYSDSIVNHLLSVVGLPDAKHKKFRALSMGMKQRLGVAKALMGNPKLLLLDEPTNGLDPMGIKDMRNLIDQNLKSKQRTIVISSHNLNEVSLVTDTFLFMRDGKKILEMDNSEDIYLFGNVQQMPDNLNVKKDITLLKDNKKETYFILSESHFNKLKAMNDFVYRDVEKLTLENLYIKLMSSDLMEMKSYV
ncbi:ATP-binding cassette domain-containing protein [Oceanobacillus jeddahense]|uniref:ATP-binding cassette domain-containing protein n=1 Tax=Oceanobacillus jeddahense TaxID=1462527 RepID=A0ABY5K120_9BACI|nr:ATP-binding cassette domain-containing protein [Oceanobacillus jeddahense]UUI04822.1 ATP-binding cassette domain-containing protein [Oceanobacillus jeddahense]